MRRFSLTLMLLLGLASFVSAGNLYEVVVQSKADADKLAATGIDPILRTGDGFLVLTDESSAVSLAASGLKTQLLAIDIQRNELAFDNRFDSANVARYPVIFAEDQVRVFRVDPSELLMRGEELQLAPVPALKMKVDFIPQAPFLPTVLRPGISLDSLMSLVNKDSLISYTMSLQAFSPRYSGTQTDYDSRDWIASKLSAMGYDSVVIDSFTATVGGVSKPCQNVVAVKVGTLFPEYQIIVGGHRDAVLISPGADDNGSGAAATMEMARILKDIPTDLTFIFILFGAEEQGLYGAWHYAGEAYARGDNIVYMLNMDMIAHFENSTQARLYHGADLTYSQLWRHLGDSLLGFTTEFAGTSSRSDHYPFTQYGYPATFVQEYVLSPVYHTKYDSTTYMNFDYMADNVKISLATVYYLNASYIPGTILISFPEPLPSMVPPNLPDTFGVQIESTLERVIDTTSGLLHYSIDGAPYSTAAMRKVSADLYDAILPGAECYEVVLYYISIADTAGNIFYNPDTSAPFSAVVADTASIIFADNFETGKGWTTSGTTYGQWERGYPIGGGDQGDPPADFDQSGICYLTENKDGNSDVDYGTVTLVSPGFDLSLGDARIRYARWFSNSSGSYPHEDVMNIFISNDDGDNWTTVETVGPVTQADGGWYEHAFWVGNFVTPTPEMRLRFDASDLLNGSIVEAAIDAVSVTMYTCGSFICGDADGNEAINILDVGFLVGYLYKGGPAPIPSQSVDVNHDGNVNILDVGYLIGYLYKGGTAPDCP